MFWSIEPAAPADLPSLMSDKSTPNTVAARGGANLTAPFAVELNDLTAMQKFYLHAGPLAYRFSGSGVRMKFLYDRTPVNAFVGYNGKYRLEFDPGSNIKIKLGYDRADVGGYRLEFAASF